LLLCQVGFALRLPGDEGDERADALGDEAVVRVDGMERDTAPVPLRQDGDERA
jgi:hypothetical protein